MFYGAVREVFCAALGDYWKEILLSSFSVVPLSPNAA